LTPGTASQFISYYPLKQGLKPAAITQIEIAAYVFISYYPLKQGLKPGVCGIKEVS